MYLKSSILTALLLVSACPTPSEPDAPEADPPSQCGNGIVEGNEDCDDGNLNNEDPCTTLCQMARCGDGAVRTDIAEGERGYESCDDANDDNTDECIDDCRQAECGDGYVHEGVEACDDGNEDDTDHCKEGCILAACGDGIIRLDLGEGDAGYEACDDGDESDGNACTNACQLARCGDGIHRNDSGPGHENFDPETTEQCDDGNDIDDDACRNNCKLPFPDPPTGCQEALSPDGRAVFWLCQERRDFSSCEAFCMTSEAFPATLDSAAKMNAVTEVAANDQAYWTSMSAWRVGDDSGWAWISSRNDPSYDPWLAGRPNFEDSDEDGNTCGWLRGGQPGLEDARCDRLAGCLCEWDGYYVAP